MNRVRQRHMNMHHGGHRGKDKRWFGVALLIVGLVIMLKKFDVFYFDFHSMWPWILITIGLLMGIKNKFSNIAPFILMGIGLAHLIPVFTIWGVTSKALLIPLSMILLGLFIIFKPRKQKLWDERCQGNIRTVTNNDSELNVDVTFGGHKEVVTSKNFKGGNISTMFGGSEINLMNADNPDKTIALNLKVSFGGVELIVPSHWQVKNEISNTLGSVEDNRVIQTYGGEHTDIVTLVLAGSCNFGSIEIKSY